MRVIATVRGEVSSQGEGCAGLPSLAGIISTPSTLGGKREHPFLWMRYSGGRVLSAESENTRFPEGGIRVAEYSRLRLSTLNRLLGICGRISRRWITRTGP